jgi:hypothetical protein
MKKGHGFTLCALAFCILHFAFCHCPAATVLDLNLGHPPVSAGSVMVNTSGVVTAPSGLLTISNVFVPGTNSSAYFQGNGAGLTNIAGGMVTGTVLHATSADTAGTATNANTATFATTAGTVSPRHIFVSTNGSNTIGAKGTLQAFATYAAARAVAISGDTIIVYPGDYAEDFDIKNGVNIYLLKGAKLTGANGIINNVLGGSCDVTGEGNIAVTQNGLWLSNYTGSIKLDKLSGGTQPCYLLGATNYLQVNTPVAGTITIRDSSMISITAPNLNAVAVQNGSRAFVYADIVSANLGVHATLNSYVKGWGNILAFSDGLDARTNSTILWYGNSRSIADAGVFCDTGSLIELHGNAECYTQTGQFQLKGSGAGVLCGAQGSYNTPVVRVYGDVRGVMPVVNENGLVEVYGNVKTLTSVTIGGDPIAPYFSAYTPEALYNSTNYDQPDITGWGWTAVSLIGSGTNRIWGDIYSCSNAAVRVQGTGRVEHYNGEIRSDHNWCPILQNAGNIHLSNSRVSAPAEVVSISTWSNNMAPITLSGTVILDKPVNAGITMDGIYTLGGTNYHTGTASFQGILGHLATFQGPNEGATPVVSVTSSNGNQVLSLTYDRIKATGTEADIDVILEPKGAGKLDVYGPVNATGTSSFQTVFGHLATFQGPNEGATPVVSVTSSNGNQVLALTYDRIKATGTEADIDVIFEPKGAGKLDVYGPVNATGYRISNGATNGNFLRGNGASFVSSTIQAGDLPTHSNDWSTITGTPSTLAGYGVNGVLTNSITGNAKTAYGVYSDLNDAGDGQFTMGAYPTAHSPSWDFFSGFTVFITGNPDYVSQFGYDLGGIPFSRNKYGGVWGNWQRVLKEDGSSYGVNITGNAATATTAMNGNNGISTTWTNLLAGIATNRIVTVGGIVVTNELIAW